MKKSLLFICASIVLATSLKAQNKTTNPFHLPKSIPTPEWVEITDWANPNVFVLDSIVKASHKEEERERRSLLEKEEFEENPYTTAYIRWRNHIAPFIQPDGSVKVDKNYHREQLMKSLENQGKETSRNKTTTGANWTLLGPKETFEEGGAKKNEQSNMYLVGVSRSNPNVLYGASEPGTFYRSSDKGLHWTSVSDTLFASGNLSLAIDPTNENTVYTYYDGGNALMKTTTGGAGWTVLSSYRYGGGNAIAINPTTGRILVAGDTKVYYSDNGGTTWTASTNDTVTGSLYDVVLNPTNGDTVYAVGSTAANGLVLLRSVNAGASFTNVTGSLSLGCNGARLGVSPNGSNVVYCVNLGTSFPCIIKSTDRGASWFVMVTSTASGLTGAGDTTGLGMSNGQGYYDLGIVVNPSNVNQLIVGTTTCYKSVDGGSNFRPLGGYRGPFALHPDMQQACAIGGDCYIATDGGINYSSDFFTNTSNWSVRNYGIRSGDFWGFGQGWDEDIVVGGRYHNGDAAISEYYADGGSLSLGGGEDATGHVYHGRTRLTGFRDIGNIRIPATLSGIITYNDPEVPNTKWPQDDFYGLFSSKLVVDPRYSNVFYVGKDSILWKSTNSGASYTSLHSFGLGNKVWRFEVCRKKPSVIYVLTTTGIKKTTDGGTTWSSLTLPATWSYYNSDVATNPLNENEVYVCMGNGSAGNKVFKSTDGGSTWTNITGSTLNNQKVAFIQYQGGTNGDIYAITNNRPSKVFYRNSTMSDWTDYSNGLTASIEAREGALIFYRDSKMRLVGNSSIWETPLNSTGAPVAQPMCDKQYVGCARDTVRFYDYSMVNYTGATWLWTFPGASFVSSTSVRTPKVVYPGPGYYSVTLKVTNASGANDTKTIDSMIYVSDDHCAPDTLPGTCLQLNGTNQTVNLGIANINSNNFSISCWAQPKGLQSSFSQLISHDVYPGSAGSGFGFGFTFSGYTPNLRLCYTDSITTYRNYSNLYCDSTKWNYVVLTYSPERVVMYLNGVADTLNSGPMPVIDLSQSPFVVNLDNHSGQGSKYNGKIEEVKFYNYALTQEEVREKMHLITNPSSETGLIKYFQFNQYDQQSGTLYDVVNNFGTGVPAANIVRSTAPVGIGKVLRLPSVSTGGVTDFAPADVRLNLPSTGTYPDGEVVAFHLNCKPDTKPDTRPVVNGYYIVNNYGINTTITPPDSMLLSAMPIGRSAFAAGNFKLFSRGTCEFGNTWGSELDSAVRFNYATSGSSLQWKQIAGINHFSSQYVVVSNDTTYFNTGVENINRAQVTVSDIYPNPAFDQCFFDIKLPVSLISDANISLTDASGKVILNINQALNGGNNHIMLPLPELKKGIYLVSIQGPGFEGVVKKLVVE